MAGFPPWVRVISQLLLHRHGSLNDLKPCQGENFNIWYRRSERSKACLVIFFFSLRSVSPCPCKPMTLELKLKSEFSTFAQHAILHDCPAASKGTQYKARLERSFLYIFSLSTASSGLFTESEWYYYQFRVFPSSFSALWRHKTSGE